MDALKLIAQSSMKADMPKIEVGDYVRVNVKIREGDKERIQAFEGTVIAMKHGGISETFTVRRLPTASVSREFSRSIRPRSIRSMFCVTASYGARSCTTCATALAKPPESKRKSYNWLKRGRRGRQRLLLLLFSSSYASYEGKGPVFALCGRA